MKRLESSKAVSASRLKRLVNETIGRSLGFEVALTQYHPDALMSKARASGLLETLNRNRLLVLEHGLFDRGTDEFYLLHDTGLFSCLSVTLWAVCDLVAAGFVPRKINFSRTLSSYRDVPGLDLHPMLFETPDVEAFERKRATLSKDRFARFDHHGAYGKLDFELLSLLIHTYMRPDAGIDERAETFRSEYLSPDARYVGVCIRGTDKGNEVPSMDSSFYIEETDRLLDAGQADRVLIQTDQAQICDLFKRHFGDRCDVIEALPRTSGKVVIHRSAPLQGRRIEFARNIIAAVSILSALPYVVTHTGNIGAWITMLRGSPKDVWQQRPEGLVKQAA